MNKSDLINSMADKSGLTKKDCGTALEGLIGSVQETLVAGSEVVITGFAKFTPRVKPAGTGRNPATGETIDVSEKVVVKIKPGSKLVEAVNA